MRKDIKEIMKRNWFFLVLLLGIIFIFTRRYIELPVSIVSHPDSQIAFSTQDGVLEQTWQPVIKKIIGLEVPYYAEDNFSCDVQLKIYSDDYRQVIVEQVKEEVNFKEGEKGNISFTFNRVSVVPGERYHIQISLADVYGQGVIRITSGSNYGGCSIAGKDMGQAAAFSIIALKYSKIFWLTAVLLPFLAFSLLGMVTFGKKWEETIALSLFVEGILLYVFGLFDHLTLGIQILYVLVVLSLLLAIYLFNRKKFSLQDLLSSGLWIYFLVFGIILLTCMGDWIANRDELRHWEIAVRDMFFYDSFAKHVNSTVILQRYLPFAALIEYAFEFMNGMFSEDILFIAYQTMLLNVLIIICKPARKKVRWWFWLPNIITMICIPVIFFNNISSCIMVDSLIAAVFAYILICYFMDDLDLFNTIRIGTAMVALVLIKDVGLIYSGMAVLIIFGDILFMQIRTRNFNLKKLLCPIAAVVLIIAVFFSWQLYLSIPVEKITENSSMVAPTDDDSGLDEETIVVEPLIEEKGETVVSAISASGITLEGIFNVLTGKGEEYQYQVTYNFITELFDGTTYSLGTISFSFIDLLTIMFLVVILLGYVGYWREDQKRMYGMAALLLGASFCLCAFLQLTYWFTFSMYEALELTSVSRYLAPYVCAVMLVVVCLILNGRQYLSVDAKKERCFIVILLLTIVISMPVADVIRESKDKEGTPEKNYANEKVVYGHDNIAEILRSVAKRGERVYFICSNSGGLSEYVFRNTICPIISEHEYWNIVSTQEAADEVRIKYGENGQGTEVLSVDSWREKLTECQYVVVFHSDEYFRQSYSELFEESENIEDGSVYQVIADQKNVSLRLIGKTGIKGWY